MTAKKKSKLINSLDKYNLIGWREWVCLPDLGVDKIKAKIDTGARTSALHAFSLEPYEENSKPMISFNIHPIQHDNLQIITCSAEIVDRRLVTDSGGHEELRYVIVTNLRIGGQTWPIEITLTERENMLFRMLLGRSALRKRFIINPARSFILKTADKHILEDDGSTKVSHT